MCMHVRAHMCFVVKRTEMFHHYTEHPKGIRQKCSQVPQGPGRSHDAGSRLAVRKPSMCEIEMTLALSSDITEVCLCAQERQTHWGNLESPCLSWLIV